ncbi:875f01ce-4a69-44a0-afed-3e6f2dd037ec [Sclerotinia trifoliorum]|uniref:875f01ce-4a69-44a0-afed-3e6f2dd037ec n=1 Tax=Sclerotinia trifoliorum TaxID=28548 RepID=A0A8H2W5G9_9HELO|nr:875f01ce-4a69-44a0-afed-3e6f2dd037ec [Sclerotinia trifoliorum]
MPPEPKSTCISCTTTTANCQKILKQVIISLENASEVYRKLVPFVSRSHARYLLGDDVYVVEGQLRRALERLCEVDIASEDGGRILTDLVGRDGSAELGNLPLFEVAKDEKERIGMKGLKRETRTRLPILNLDTVFSDIKIPFVDSAVELRSSGMIDQVLLDDDIMVFVEEDCEQKDIDTERCMELAPVPTHITPEYPYLLKAIRLWLEGFFDTKGDSLGIPESMVSQLAGCEKDFGLDRLPTTSCVWNADYQRQRKEVWEIVSFWGPNQRSKCICEPGESDGNGFCHVNHWKDPYCPKNMPIDLDSPSVEYTWNYSARRWIYHRGPGARIGGPPPPPPPHFPRHDDNASDSGSDSDSETDEQAAERVQRLKKERAEKAEKAWEEIMGMTGLKGVKEHVQKLKAKVESSIRQNIDLKEERFGAVFMGSSGTGKTTMAKIYARYLYSMGIIQRDEVIETTGTYLSDGGIERTKRYIDRLANGGVMFIDDAMTLDDYSNGTKILDFIFQEIDHMKGSVVFILAGHEKGMRKLLGHGAKSVTSLLPNVLTFDDFSESELLEILSSCIKKKFDGKMEVEGGYNGLYMRIAVKRVSRTRGGSDFGNARAVENLVAQIWERQSARLSKVRKERATKAAEDEATKKKIDEERFAEESKIREQNTGDNTQDKLLEEEKSDLEQNSDIAKCTGQVVGQEDKIEATNGSSIVVVKENTDISKDGKATKSGEMTEATGKPLREKSSMNDHNGAEVLEPPAQGILVSEKKTKEKSIVVVSKPADLESPEDIAESNSVEGIKSEEPKPDEDTTLLAKTEVVVDEPAPIEETVPASIESDGQLKQVDEDSSKVVENCTEDQARKDETSNGDKLSDEAQKSPDKGSDAESNTGETPVIDPEDLLFTKEDILGPDPSAAILNSEAWQELQKLIGLEKVKTSLLTLLELVKTNYQRELEEKPLHQFTLNRLFLGPAGTGKTVVAKLYAKILGEIGVLSKGEVIFRNPSDLIGQYIGHSEANTKAALNAARGNVLVIDEAYMMYSGNSDGTGNESDSFRQGVIDTLVAEVQGNPGEDRCVLLLGYREPMLEMLNHSNPGLSRRFPVENAFSFENFSIDELGKILRSKLEHHVLEATEEAIKVAMDVLKKASTRLNFGNGGEVENLIASARTNYQLRMSKIPVEERSAKWVFQPEDFDPEYDRGRSANANLLKLFGDVIGCENIVKQLGQYQNVWQAMKARNIDPRNYIPTNFVFKGPPGTGKTTTARKFAKVYYDMGFLSGETVIECSASDLIGKYVGHSGPKTAKVLEKALGKVLFIDEAYRLAPHTENYSFTSEVVSELVDLLTKPKFHGNLIVILAGYEDEINSLLAANPGLASRFPEEMNFPALTPLHCLKILEIKLRLAGIAIPILNQTERREYEQLLRLMTLLTATHSWGNARDVDTLAKAICRSVFLEMPVLEQGELVCSVENAMLAVEVMLHERRRRAYTALPPPRYE